MRLPLLAKILKNGMPTPAAVTLLVVGIAMLAVLAPTHAAAAGTYTVSVPTTASTYGWWTYGSTAPFAVSDRKISTKIGAFRTGENRIWRMNVPDLSVRIAGGSVKASIATKNDVMEARIREGNSGGAVKTLLASKSASGFTGALAADSTWFEFGLVARAATSTSIVGGNWIHLDALSVVLADSVDPRISITTMPDVNIWHGSGCTTLGATVTDAGSGIAKYELVNMTTNKVVETWTQAIRAGLQPGTPSSSRTTCINGAQQQTGMNQYTVRTYDASQRSTEVQFHLRFDNAAPTITPVTVANTAFTTPNPFLAVDVVDADSGVKTVETLLDGVAISHQTDGIHTHVQPVNKLAVGSHVLHVQATDTAGNFSKHDIVFSVVDSTAPIVSIVSPTASGGASPWLAASAQDESSGVNAGTWVVTVDDVPLPALALSTAIAAPIGNLTVGQHVIWVSVADVSGNVGHATMTYTVLGTSPVGDGASIGGATGLFVAASPKTVIQQGTRIHVILTAASHGRPLEGHRILAQLGSRLLASDDADANGVADLFFTATSPGVVALSAADGSVPAATIQLKVSPRLTLRSRVHRPKVGAAVRITGRMTPVILRKVALQARIGNAWFPLRRLVSVDANGRFSTTVTATVPGKIAIRVVSKSRHGWSAATSNIVVLRIRR